ncbi:MAG: YIP1 family protein [Coriobacteriia bacterium]|nr:YIP1 family protein [Coriobacteriia bacterium]
MMQTKDDDAPPFQEVACGRERVISRFVGVLVSPGATFMRLASDSDWLRPLSFMLAVVSAYSFAVILRVPTSAAAELVGFSSTTALAGLRAAGLLVAIVITMFGWFAWVTALYVSFWALGARTSMPQALTIIGYAAAPGIIKSATLTVVVLVTGHMPVAPTLASILHARGAVATVLGSVEPFAIWNFVLLVIAASCSFGFTWRRSTAAVLLPVTLGWFLQLSLGSLIA